MTKMIFFTKRYFSLVFDRYEVLVFGSIGCAQAMKIGGDAKAHEF